MIVLCGIQASGKSRFAREHWYESHVRINLDMLRTRNREDIVLYVCLAAKTPIVVDHTNPIVPRVLSSTMCSFSTAVAGMDAVTTSGDFSTSR